MAQGWNRLLLRTTTNAVKAIPANLELILSHERGWKGVLAFDELAGSVVFLKNPPWHSESKLTESQVNTSWTDEDTTRLRNWCARTWKFSPSAADTCDVVSQVAGRTRIHPIRDHLSTLRWDKKPRIDTWLSRICGAEDNEYTRAVGSKWLIAAVARVFEPGCKVDTMPLFEGDQGTGKSTMLRILAIREVWFLETNIDLGGKDSLQILRRKWIVEFAEIDSLSRSEVSRAKAFISARYDTYRPSFGRRSQDFPRQCVFAGTLNPDGGYLKDTTGARRFWPIKLEYINLNRLRKEVEQLWAEAVARYKAKEAWHFEGRQLVRAAAKEAEDRRQVHPWESVVEKWLSKRRDQYAERGITTHEVLQKCIGKTVVDLGRADEMVMASVLRKCGWSDVYRDQTTPGRPRRYRNPAFLADVENTAVEPQEDGFLPEGWVELGSGDPAKKPDPTLTQPT